MLNFAKPANVTEALAIINAMRQGELMEGNHRPVETMGIIDTDHMIYTKAYCLWAQANDGLFAGKDFSKGALFVENLATGKITPINIMAVGAEQLLAALATTYTTPELKAYANEMNKDCIDWQEGGAIPAGLILCAYHDGVWLCDPKDECEPVKFARLECITPKCWVSVKDTMIGRDPRDMIAEAIKTKKGIHVGACLTFLNGEYVMYASTPKRKHEVKLAASATNQGRLNAHWIGFVENLEEWYKNNK